METPGPAETDPSERLRDREPQNWTGFAANQGSSVSHHKNHIPRRQLWFLQVGITEVLPPANPPSSFLVPPDLKFQPYAGRLTQDIRGGTQVRSTFQGDFGFWCGPIFTRELSLPGGSALSKKKLRAFLVSASSSMSA